MTANAEYLLVCPRCLARYPEKTDCCPDCLSELCEAQDLERIGQRLHNYEITEIIGVGGMGVVYKATHVSLLKPLAIKILNDRHGQRRDAAREMLREAQAASRIRHPNIVDVTDFGNTPDGAPYIVMEYLVGESLNELLARLGRLSIPRAVAMIRQVSSALAAAHRVGIIHRDLKPENIFLVDLTDTSVDGRQPGDFIKLLDFGLAKVMDMGPSSRTRSGLLAGTPYYMSPEQAQNRSVDARSDVYSLGIVFYQMVTGMVPFHGPSSVDILMAHITAAPVPPRELCPSVNEQINELILCCLQKDPELRFGCMEELCAELDRCEAGRRSGQRDGATDAEPTAAASVPSAVTLTSELMGLVLGDGETDPHSAGPAPLPRARPGLPPSPTVTSDVVGKVLAEPEDKEGSFGPGVRPVLPSMQSARQSGPAGADIAGTEAPGPAIEGAGGPVPEPVPEPMRPWPGSRTARRVALAAALGGLALAGGLAWILGRAPGPSAAVEAQPRQERVHVVLQGLPAGARVTLDGSPTSKRRLWLPRSKKSHLIAVQADGYRPAQRRFVATRSLSLDLSLTALADTDHELVQHIAPASRPVATPAARSRTRGKRNAPGRVRRSAVRAAPVRKAPGSGEGQASDSSKGPLASAPQEPKELRLRPAAAPDPPSTKPETKSKTAKTKKYRDWVVDPDL